MRHASIVQCWPFPQPFSDLLMPASACHSDETEHAWRWMYEGDPLYMDVDEEARWKGPTASLQGWKQCSRLADTLLTLRLHARSGSG